MKTIVYFYGPNCGPCKAIKPELERAKQANRGKDFKVIDINAEDPEKAGFVTAWNVTSLPTIILDEPGRERVRLTGASASTLEAIRKFAGDAA